MYKVITRLNQAQIGNELRKIRETRGITQSDLAKEIGACQTTISKIEGGKNQDMSLQMFLEICKKLNVSLVITDEQTNSETTIAGLIQKLQGKGLRLILEPEN